MRFSSFLAAIAVLFAVSGCASLIDGPTQPIRIDTPGASESECHLTNGRKYRLRGGETIRIQRSERDLVIDCYGVGNRYKQVIIPSSLNEWGIANVSNAVIPGVTYDHLSGALYAYPVAVSIDFTGTPAHGFEVPVYHNVDALNPYTQPIERYGASKNALPGDNTAPPSTLQKRETNLNSNPFSVNGTGAGSAAASPSSSLTREPSVSAPPSVPARVTGTPTGRNADELTRSANPDVFGAR